jgi:ribosomal protein L37E
MSLKLQVTSFKLPISGSAGPREASAKQFVQVSSPAQARVPRADSNLSTIKCLRCGSERQAEQKNRIEKRPCKRCGENTAHGRKENPFDPTLRIVTSDLGHVTSKPQRTE